MDNHNLIRYKIFTDQSWLVAFTTTKDTLPRNSVRFTGEDEQEYLENRRELAALLDIDSEQLVFPRQTHSSTVCKIDETPENELKETDALVTNKAGLCLCVQTADCVPVLLADPKKRVVAAVHAGWRGTVGKIVSQTIEKLQQDFGCNPDDLLAAVGPSIGPEVYEVGAEVVEAAHKAIPEASKTLHLNFTGKYHFDLWGANRLLLLDAGLKESNIEVLEACSYRINEKYFSARRDGVYTGRMVTGIMLRE